MNLNEMQALAMQVLVLALIPLVLLIRRYSFKAGYDKAMREAAPAGEELLLSQLRELQLLRYYLRWRVLPQLRAAELITVPTVLLQRLESAEEAMPRLKQSLLAPEAMQRIVQQQERNAPALFQSRRERADLG